MVGCVGGGCVLRGGRGSWEKAGRAGRAGRAGGDCGVCKTHVDSRCRAFPRKDLLGGRSFVEPQPAKNAIKRSVGSPENSRKTALAIHSTTQESQNPRAWQELAVGNKEINESQRHAFRLWWFPAEARRLPV